MTVDSVPTLIAHDLAERLLHAAAAVYRIDRNAMTASVGRSRQKQPVTRAVWAVMQALANIGFNNLNIAEVVERDHATVFVALRTIRLSRAVETDAQFKQAVAACDRVLAIEEMYSEELLARLEAVIGFASSVRSIAKLVESQSRALEQQAAAMLSALAVPRNKPVVTRNPVNQDIPQRALRAIS